MPFVNRFVLLLVVAGSVVLWGGPLRAQEPGPITEPFRLHDQTPAYRAKAWSVEDGLPLNVVWAIEQTRDGTLWAGTLDGLAHFDGHSFRTFTAADTDGLAGNRVVGLHEDASGTLWIGTGTGVSTYRNGTFRRIDGLSGHVEDFSEPPDGTIWMGGRSGLYRWTKGEEPVSVRLPESLQGKNVKVASRGSDSVWVASEKSLRLYADGSFRQPERLMGLVENRITSLVASSDRLLIATDSVLVVVGEKRLETYVHDGGRVKTVRVAPSGEVWMTTLERGLLRLSEGTVQPVRVDGALGDRLHGLTRDDRGQWWVGDHNRGLIRLRPALFRAVDGGLSGQPDARAVYADDDGVVWAGIGQNGLFQFDDSTRTQWTPTQGLPGRVVRTISEDASGVLWVGTNRGLARLRGDRFDVVRTPDGHDFTLMSALQQDSTGTLWIASEEQGLYAYRSGTLERVLSTDSLRSARVMGLLRARDGALWIGTREHGVARLEEETELTWYDTDDGVPYRSVRDIYQTGNGTLWISTSGGGIARFEGDHFTPVTPDEGLPHRSIHLIREAPEGIFWMTSNGGVFRVRRSQVEAVADGRRNRIYARAFGTADGMPARECNGPIHPAFAEDGRGHLWIPTVGGLAVIDPHAPQLTVPDSLPVRVTTVRADGQPRLLDSLRFAPSTYRVALDFTAVSLRHADDLSFRYRLDDGSWTAAQGRRTAEFTNLGGGTHRFEVQATVDGETWYALDTPLHFTVSPHFYETWWFRLLVVLSALGVALGAYRWRTYRLRKRQETLEATVEARTYELAEQKKKTERQAERLAELDEAKNRFFAHVSHEFRTPLSLILSPLEDAAQRAEEEISFGRQQIHRMTDNARRLRRLIDQLLDLATLEAGQMELERQPGDLATVVTRSAEAFRSKAEEQGIDLRIERPDGRIETRFDPEKVETIASNLVGNAVKFTPSGGTVIVRVATDEDAGTVEAPGKGEIARGTARIRVEDTGPGIEPDVQDQIFDRFEQADRSTTRAHEGTGLGLALTRELVELHGGTIAVDSTPGDGSTFVVELPLVPVAAGARENGREGKHERENLEMEERRPVKSAGDGPQGEAEPEEGDEKAAVILIVEDNVEMRAYLREVLSGRWQVIEAADGEEGWEVAREQQPDLVVSDVMMPGQNGFELCRQIKEDPELRSVPVLLLTARAGEEATLEGLASGADDYVAKPFGPQELRQRIENHLSARRHLRERYRNEVSVEELGMTIEVEEQSFVEEVIEAIDRNLGNPDFRVGDLAEAMALSRRQLTRRVKRAIGEPPGELIRRCRIQRARKMLEAGPETIAEVAYATGFRSPSHFSQSFREAVGRPPSEYAEQHEG